MTTKPIFATLLLVCLFLLSSSCAGKSADSGTNFAADKRPIEFENDDKFLDFIQQAHFNYMWEGAEPTSGLACERKHMDGVYPDNDPDVITIGGSGFGVSGLIVGVERGFITREQGVERMHKIVDYLTRADRFHGVWPHWLNGPTGKVKPFGTKDDGGDLVESAFLMQGLLCGRQYFDGVDAVETSLRDKINTLWHEMEWSWYQNNTDSLYWHWSPNYAWEMNFPLKGYNECLITYVLGAASPTHPITAKSYEACWHRDGAYTSSASPYGIPLIVKHNGAEEFGGPLFWAHYSWIGLNPKGLSDRYVNYWDVNVNHVKVNYAYCVENPKSYTGYGSNCWGLTASYSEKFYDAHMPSNDKGVITPTAALSSFPYTPEESMAALKHFYFDRGDQLWGKYGFYDAFSPNSGWIKPWYLAIDQCTIAPMIENYRSGLLWRLFMSCPEVQQGLSRLGFTIQ